MSKKILKLNVQGSDITIITDTENDENDYICLTDIANKFGNTKLIDNWLQNKNTIEFLGFWEVLHNQNFNSLELQEIKKEAGLNRFIMSVKKWVKKTNAIGISAKTGKYNSGTYAHKDIAMQFCSWISPEFQLYIIKEFQRLKKEEARRSDQINEWDNHRWLSKVNFRVFTDAVKDNLIPLSNISLDKEWTIYASESDMYNKIMFNMTNKEFRDKYPNAIGNIREEIATTKQLQILANLEVYNATMIRDGLSQKQRFAKLVVEKEAQEKSIPENNFNKNSTFADLLKQQTAEDIILKENPELKTKTNPNFEKDLENIVKTKPKK